MKITQEVRKFAVQWYQGAETFIAEEEANAGISTTSELHKETGRKLYTDAEEREHN